MDPWRFTGTFLERVLSANIPEQPAYETIPWAPFSKPLAEAKVALHSTAGISMKGDAPFDMEMERRNPLRGDPSFRRLRADATAQGLDRLSAGEIEAEIEAEIAAARTERQEPAS